MLQDVGDDVEDVDGLSQTDEEQDELVSLVDILNLLPQAAGHVEEPDQGREGVVHQTGEARPIQEGSHHETFLEMNKKNSISNL